MQYRALGNTGLTVSEVGFGGEYLEGQSYAVVEEAVRVAYEGGVNIMDVFMSEPNVRTNIGRAIAPMRKEFLLQGHFRPVWQDGQYARSLDIDQVKRAFDDLLTRLKTDYVDIGMMHMIDNDCDYRAAYEGEIYQYMCDMQRAGVVRVLGLSTHSPSIGIRAVNDGVAATILFSMNAAHDLLSDDGADGPVALRPDLFEEECVNVQGSLRSEFYRLCALKGIGITVMKGLAAGVLLDAACSPFGVAMSVPQCIHYALSKPAVASVLIGAKNSAQMQGALYYEQASEKERDFSEILTHAPRFSLKGHCMYCNHCLPCAMHIDIARINQYVDMRETAASMPPTLQAHYDALEHTASSCVECGICEERCPFEVPIMERMARAAQLFGK